MKIWLPAVVALLALLVAACGDDDDSSTATVTATAPAASASATADATTPAASRTPTPAPPLGATRLPPGTGQGSSIPGTPIEPGTYYSGLFEPRVVLTVGADWGNAGETKTKIALLRRPEPGDIALSFDSRNANQSVNEVVEALSSINGTTAGPVTDTTIAGFSGKQVEFDVTESAVAVPGLSEVYTSLQGDRLHAWVVDVNGTTVTLLAEAPGDEFADYLPIAQEVVDSVRFE